jgi:cell wall-associated protease
MISKTSMWLLALPITFSSAFARTLQIPKAEQDLKLIKQNQAHYVLKNSKGTLLSTQFLMIRPENWFNLSPAEGIEGVRTEETYKSFGMPKSEEIIVAVIDSGVDVNHEDLQGKIWINSDEIPNDGIDNDQNGYVDDIFGWNFIGGSNGMAKIVKDETLANGLRLIKGNSAHQIDIDSLEVTRELVRMKKLKNQVEELGESLTPAQEAYLNRLIKEVSAAVKEATEVVATFSSHLKKYKGAEAILKSAGLSTMSIDAVRSFETTDASALEAKQTMLMLLSNRLNEARILRILGAYGDRLQYMYNENFNPRSIVGDHYTDLNERFYGNNDVIGPDSSHGTHVSGIIAAVRDNGIGMKGVATNVKIMAIRAVPNGDERDKDIANSIRYAVDNGARVINMSFGKGFSPYKKAVDEAVRYAESKGVLLVHAAGNSNQNNDTEPNFPNRFDKSRFQEFSNWLEIGASSFQKGLTLPADFSNFGKRSVDFFAPGVDIYSTTPDNSYDTYSGTSMASPTAAGVASLILSYGPSLEANELRMLMIDTSRRYPKLKVKIPGSDSQILFSSLSTYGSVVDAFEAVNTLK